MFCVIQLDLGSSRLHLTLVNFSTEVETALHVLSCFLVNYVTNILLLRKILMAYSGKHVSTWSCLRVANQSEFFKNDKW